MDIYEKIAPARGHFHPPDSAFACGLHGCFLGWQRRPGPGRGCLAALGNNGPFPLPFFGRRGVSQERGRFYEDLQESLGKGLDLLTIEALEQHNIKEEPPNSLDTW